MKILVFLHFHHFILLMQEVPGGNKPEVLEDFLIFPLKALLAAKAEVFWW